MVDGDWQRLPTEVQGLPLTRLHLRFADFGDEGWLPAGAAAALAPSLRCLELPGCQIRCAGRAMEMGGLLRAVCSELQPL